MAQGKPQMRAAPVELLRRQRFPCLGNAFGDEAVFDAGNRQHAIHLNERVAELVVVFRCKNARKCWTELGLVVDYGHVLHLSLLW